MTSSLVYKRRPPPAHLWETSPSSMSIRDNLQLVYKDDPPSAHPIFIFISSSLNFLKFNFWKLFGKLFLPAEIRVNHALGNYEKILHYKMMIHDKEYRTDFIFTSEPSKNIGKSLKGFQKFPKQDTLKNLANFSNPKTKWNDSTKYFKIIPPWKRCVSVTILYKYFSNLHYLLARKKYWG